MINDVHLNTTGSDGGLYGEDAKLSLFKTMVDDLAAAQQPLDALMILGDFVIHGLSSREENVSNWDQMQPSISQQMLYIKEKLPNVVVLPTFGNNDMVQYYQVPRDEATKQAFYGDLYDMWFGGANAQEKN